MPYSTACTGCRPGSLAADTHSAAHAAPADGILSKQPAMILASCRRRRRCDELLSWQARRRCPPRSKGCAACSALLANAGRHCSKPLCRLSCPAQLTGLRLVCQNTTGVEMQLAQWSPPICSRPASTPAYYETTCMERRNICTAAQACCIKPGLTGPRSPPGPQPRSVNHGIPESKQLQAYNAHRMQRH